MEKQYSPLSRKKIIWFLTLTSLILLSNTAVYHIDIGFSVPEGMVYGSLFDLLLIIPLLTYFLIIRKRYSFKVLSFVIAAGYLFAWWMIPNEHLRAVPFLKYIIFIGEGAFILLELYIGFKIVSKFPSIYRHWKATKTTGHPYWHERLEKAVHTSLKSNFMTKVYISEFTLFHYSLFSWKKKTATDVPSFTLHEKTSVIAFYVMLIHAVAIETIGFHYFLHDFSPVLSWVLLILNVYSIIFFLAEIQAIRLCPLLLEKQHMFIQVGILKKIKVPYHSIKSIEAYDGPEKLPKDIEKITFVAMVPDMLQEKPQFQIQLEEPLQASYLYGFKKKVEQIHIRVDDPNAFMESLQEKRSD
jgi:membrane protein YdbS with pleckstrin-like domain